MKVDAKTLELITAARHAKTEKEFSALVFKARKIWSGPELVSILEVMRMNFEQYNLNKNPELVQTSPGVYVPSKKTLRKAFPKHVPQENPMKLGKTHYYTVLVPWSPRPTAFHPTDKTGPFSVLSRGAFKTRREATIWARDHLAGEPYKVKRISYEGESTRTMKRKKRITSKPKRAAKAKPKSNPTKHIPKTNRGRKPEKRKFTITKYDAQGGFLGNVSFSGTIANAENKAAKMVKGRVARVMLQY